MDSREKFSRRNPRETANFLSILCFGWTAPILWKGTKKDLNLTDLYDPLECDKSERLGDLLGREWEKELARSKEQAILEKFGKKKPAGRGPNLVWAIVRVFWAPYMIQGLLLLIHQTVLQLIPPILQGLIISYFDSGKDTITKTQVLIYAVLLMLVTFGAVFIFRHAMFRCNQIGMCVRVACCSMIYRKILRLNQVAVNNTAAGQIANLMSNDVARFDEISLYLHYIWIMPIQISLIGYIMWKSAGVASLVGIGLMILQTVPIQGYMSSLAAGLRSTIASYTDERVQLMSELFAGIQVVKIYAWEKPFESIVSRVRRLEMKFIARTSYLRAFDLSMIIFPCKISLYSTLITFVMMGNALTAEITFVLVGLFAVLQELCSIGVPQGIIVAGEASVSLERIKTFLQLEEVECSRRVEGGAKNELKKLGEAEECQQTDRSVGIELIKLTANWVRDQLPPTLSEVSIKVESRSLCAVVGPVGSGKSSLLHLMLGELPLESGRISIFDNETSASEITLNDIRVSYASQDPWLFSASIRENILFGEAYNEKRYQQVTRACTLLRDFEALPQGDLTFVGERGTALSGGQRARINLARAVYRDAELYLLDDPLSSVDAYVSRNIFQECISGILKNKTRILVTHQLQYLRQADTIVILNRGVVEGQGTYDELVKGNFLVPELKNTEKSDNEDDGFRHHGEKTVFETTESTSSDENDEHCKATKSDEESLEDFDEEEIATGHISRKVYWDYFSAGGSVCSLIILVIAFIVGQISVSGTDYWVTYWSEQETRRATISQFNESISDHTSFRSNYTEAESFWFDEDGLLHRNLGIYIYTIILVSCILLITLRCVLFTRMSVSASRKIHDSIFQNLLRSTMRFFDTNPSGRILNRFTKDMGKMDEILPKAMIETFQVFSTMIGILTLVVLANYWMIIPAFMVCGFCYIVRIYYLKTAQDVRRLEGNAKSPMFTHANSTLSGLTTIRSRGPAVEGLLRGEFDRYQDVHSGSWYLAIGTSAAFEFVLDLISCSFIACICFTFILMDDKDTLGGFVGLAISQSLVLIGIVQYGIKQSTEVVSQMTSVERILQYTKLPQEGPYTTDKPPPPTWPPEGSLVLKDVSMRYAENKPLILKNLNLTINAGWKIGVVGRTGSGKSSLISALFRLTGDGLEGEILLDEIDTKSIGLHELRPRISIIPQEPILFSASLRYNLDPFEQYSDAELWESLREVELGEAIPSLDFRVAGGGANFSVGQRQLICLARAILRKNRLLVLDEATANVDNVTDALIQKTIRRRFVDCTVLTIAHRLNTIMDCDRVLVMQDGRIVEFDHPHLLLENGEGHFSQMLQHTGKTMADQLAGIAESTYLKSSKYREKPLATEQITHL